MESLNKLIQTLEEMTDAHTRLLGLAEEKRTILVDGNIQELQSLINRESSCVNEIEKLEQKRMQFVQVYLAQKGLTGQSFTLEELINIQNDATTKTTLDYITNQLRGLIEKITQMNESNQQLIHTSLSYIQYSMGMLVRKEPSIGYGPYAKSRYSNMLDAKV
ncbi:flagellar protein FlgN [Neobacillus drentensis]|uniref:flagellar protein FlgN n=1 Tax=Neobacillus drentensis TaxID=220684 RepID=UPI002865E161|nr:flagellar protein FlgN [Neobacillus drentensis]MDR7235705.1 flagellar biosynthesis/type III secretory pathway chaperone [Neobacillus drentensis]